MQHRAGGVATRSPPSAALASGCRIRPLAGQDHRTGEPGSGSCDRLSAFSDVLGLNRCSFPPLRLPYLGSLLRFPEPLTELVQFRNLNKEIGRITGEN
jgi:hypothetical protein